MVKNRSFIAVLLILLLFPYFLPAAGMPVFDIENWVYSILSYSEQATQVVNFVENMEREIDQANKLYKALESGDLLSALNSMNGVMTIMEKTLGRYVQMSNLTMQLSDIRQAGTAWANHVEDPDYFLSMVSEVRELKATTAALEKEHKEDLKESQQDVVNNNRKNSEEVASIASSNSEMEKLAATYKTAVGNGIKQDRSIADQMVSDEIDRTQIALEEVERDLEGKRLIATVNAANKEAAGQMLADVPDINIDMTDPYAV